MFVDSLTPVKGLVPVSAADSTEHQPKPRRKSCRASGLLELIKDLISRSRDQVAGSRSPSTARRRRLLGKRFGTPQVFAVTGWYVSGPELWRDVWSGRSTAVWAAREEQLLIAMAPRWLSVRGRCALSAYFGCAKWFSRNCGFG